MKRSCYVVILESPDSGYMDCVGVFDEMEIAFGAAYNALVAGLEPKEYYITLPMEREGENGVMLQCVDFEKMEVQFIATVLNCEDNR